MAFTTLTRGRVRLVLCLHTDVDPTAAEWQHMLSQLTFVLAETPDTRYVRMLVVTGGGGPDAKQRAQLREVWADLDIKVAVLIPGRANPLKRGLMTALTWINPSMNFFTPEQLRHALAHLDQEYDLGELWKNLCALQTQLDTVPTLQRIAQTNALPRPSAG